MSGQAKWLPWLGMAVLTISATAQAAPPSNGPMSAKSGSALPDQLIAAPSGRTDSRLKGFDGVIEINGSTPKTTLSFGDRLLPHIRAGGPDGMSNVFSQTSYALALSIPLGGKDNLVDPQLLDGLSDGPALTFSLSRYHSITRDDVSGFKSAGWQIGAEASLGSNQFHYRDPTMLTKHSEWKPQFAAGAFLVIYPGEIREEAGEGRKSMFAFAVDYQSSYEAADAIILCKAAPIDPDEDCVKAAPRAPDRKDSLNLSFEYRRAMEGNILGGQLALSPKFTYDSLNDDFGAELPLYLILDGDAPVLPGFKIGYASQENEVTFGLFLKASFSMSR